MQEAGQDDKVSATTSPALLSHGLTRDIVRKLNWAAGRRSSGICFSDMHWSPELRRRKTPQNAPEFAACERRKMSGRDVLNSRQEIKATQPFRNILGTLLDFGACLKAPSALTEPVLTGHFTAAEADLPVKMCSLYFCTTKQKQASCSQARRKLHTSVSHEEGGGD